MNDKHATQQSSAKQARADTPHDTENEAHPGANDDETRRAEEDTMEESERAMMNKKTEDEKRIGEDWDGQKARGERSRGVGRGAEREEACDETRITRRQGGGRAEIEVRMRSAHDIDSDDDRGRVGRLQGARQGSCGRQYGTGGEGSYTEGGWREKGCMEKKEDTKRGGRERGGAEQRTPQNTRHAKN